MTVPIDQPDWQNPQAGMAVYAPIATNLNVAAGGQTAAFDLSAYDTIIIWSNTALTTGHNLQVTDADSLNVLAVIESPPDALGNTARATMLPVRPQSIRVNNNAASAISLNIRGTSRKVNDAKSLGQADDDLYTVALPAAAGVTPLGYVNGCGQGFVYLELSLSTISGWFELQSGSKALPIAQHGELLAGPGGVRTITKAVVFPIGSQVIQFHATSAIAGTARAALLYPPG